MGYGTSMKKKKKKKMKGGRDSLKIKY